MSADDKRWSKQDADDRRKEWEDAWAVRELSASSEMPGKVESGTHAPSEMEENGD